MAESEIKQIRPLPPRLGQTGMAAHHEDQILTLHFGLFKDARELIGVEGLAGRIEQNFFGGWMFLPDIHSLWPLRPDLRHLRCRIVSRATHILLSQRVGLRVLRLPDVVKVNLQAGVAVRRRGVAGFGAATASAGISTVLPSRQSRSRS